MKKPTKVKELNSITVEHLKRGFLSFSRRKLFTYIAICTILICK